MQVQRGALRFGDVARWAAAPRSYLASALALSSLDGFFSHPFLDVPRVG